MIDYISSAIGLYLCWYNAGGTRLNTSQMAEYLTARIDCWAYSKVK